MLRRMVRSGAAVGLVLPVLAACVQSTPVGSTTGAPGIRQAIGQAMTDCTAAHGFDPDIVTVDDGSLAPGEREWRACVYAAIEARVIPQTPVPAAYRELIAEDRTMTDAIAAGSLTRSARRARLEDLADDIRSAEAWAAGIAEIDAAADAALASLYQQYPEARDLVAGSAAVLVFPEIYRGGLIIGGQYGEGVLRRGAVSDSYYETISASYGLQIGGQSFGYALIFRNEEALSWLDRSDGWEVGVGPSVVFVDEGVAGTLTTTTAQEGIYAFIFDQAGLMAGAGLQGSKITRLELGT